MVFPMAAPKGSSRLSLGILNLRWGLIAEAAGLYLLLRCVPRHRCVGAQGFVAFGNVKRWGSGFPLEVPTGLPQGFDQRFPQRSP